VASIFSDNAVKFHELGFNVIPISGKRPTIEKWSFYCTHSQTEAEVLGLIPMAERATGIGIVLGHGVIALDIDTDDERVLALLPESNLIKKGKTGLTAFYRTNAKVHKKSSLEHPVELLAVGAQSVIPPSIHPDTKQPYRWEMSDPIHVKELIELKKPEEDFKRILEFCKTNKIFRTIKDAPGDDRTITDVISTDSPLGVGGRNNYLTQAAYAKCCSMKLDGLNVEQVGAWLLELDRKIFGKKAWFDDAKEHPVWRDLTPIQRAVEFCKRAQKSSLNNGHMNEEYKIEIVPEEVPTIEEEPNIDLMRDGFFEVPTASGYQKLLDSVPFLEAWSEYLVNNSDIYSPALTLGSGLAALSACASNTYTFNNAAPNLFIANVGATGFGKDAPQRALKKLMYNVAKAGSSYIGFDRYDSSKGVLLDLAANPKRIRVDVMDEVSSLFEQLNFSENNPHKVTVENMCMLWSAGRSSMGKNAVLDKAKKITPVANPHLVWIGSTTGRGLQALIDNKAAWEKGLVSRTLFFIETRTELPEGHVFLKDPGDIRIEADGSFAPIITDTIESTMLAAPKMASTKFDYSANPFLAPILSAEVPYTKEAARIINEHAKQIEAIKTEYDSLLGENQTHPISIALTRRVEMICRLLACWFVGNGCVSRVDEGAVEWATKVMSYSQGSLVRYMKANDKGITEQLIDRLKPVRGKRELVFNLKKRVAVHLKALLGKEQNPQMIQVYIRDLMDSGYISAVVGTRKYYVWQ
jgi:hypothetical protein